MRRLPLLRSAFLLAATVACSDSSRTLTGARERGQAQPQADIVHSANPLDVLVQGDAKGCFGLGCTPADATSYTSGNLVLIYTSLSGSDFTGMSRHGLLGLNGPNQSFGSIVASVGSGDFNVPFTLEITFTLPTVAAPVVFHGTITGTGAFTPIPNNGAYTEGGFVLDFDPASGPTTAGTTSSWIRFTDPATSADGMLDVTPFGIALPTTGFDNPIPGLIVTRVR